jgi:amidohydrolase
MIGPVTDLKAAAAQHLERIRPDALALSHRIHAHPELGFAEHDASRWVSQALSGAGFSVQAGVGDLPTALAATAGTGELTVGLFAEYDALPEIGHACGHNIIAAAATTAGQLLAPLADQLGITVKVFGTPAEEAGGGKILMLDRGVFDGVHAAMMVHPSPTDRTAPAAHQPRQPHSRHHHPRR